MARRYLNLGHDEWQALPWPVQRAYLEGMEADESVPLVTRDRGPGEAAESRLRWQERNQAPAEVIDLTGMIAGLEAARGTAR